MKDFIQATFFLLKRLTAEFFQFLLDSSIDFRWGKELLVPKYYGYPCVYVVHNDLSIWYILGERTLAEMIAVL